MQRLNIEYNNIYVPDWDRTIFIIKIIDEHGNEREYVDYKTGRLIEKEKRLYFEKMYNCCSRSEILP